MMATARAGRSSPAIHSMRRWSGLRQVAGAGQAANTDASAISPPTAARLHRLTASFGRRRCCGSRFRRSPSKHVAILVRRHLLRQRRIMKTIRRPSPPAPLLPTALALFLAGAALTQSAVAAEDPTVAAKKRAERTNFSDSEIVEGFMKTAFGAEFQLAGRVDRIRKYAVPIRVFAEGASRERRRQLAAVVTDIGMRVQHLDIAMVETREAATIEVRLVRDRDLYPTIAKLYGHERAREIKRSLDPQCLSGFRKNDKFEIEHFDVILATDVSDFTFLDCAYEELLQALGPINDTGSVPWTMFNDQVQMGFFDVYDQYILNLLYDPRIAPGMTVEEVKAVLPEALAEARAFVRKVNNLPE